jgi:hypothetical protein
MAWLLPSWVALRFLQALAYMWAGVIIGISFLEAPVKFTAPSVTRAIGLDVGRHVFAALNGVELGCAGLGMGLTLWGAPDRAVVGVGVGVLIALLVQTVWLLPELRAQARRIIAGGAAPTETNHAHLAYGVLEGLKVLGLLYVGGGLGG